MLHIIRCALTRRTLWLQPHFSSSFLSNVIGKKNVRRPDDVIMWPQMTFQREMMQQRAGDIKHSLSDYDSGWVGQIWCILERPPPPPPAVRGLNTELQVTQPSVTCKLACETRAVSGRYKTPIHLSSFKHPVAFLWPKPNLDPCILCTA